MPILISIIVFILIFSVLILVHEFGHFWMAKRAGVRVEEFGFGLPPRMTGKKKGDTLYSLNWIPFGGFVRLFGEDPSELRALKSKESFITKTSWQKITIVLGGVFMNFVLAWALITFGLIFGLEPLIVGYDQFADQIHKGNVDMSPYYVFEKANEQFEVEPGDFLVSINNVPLDRISDVDKYVESLEGTDINLKVRHFSGDDKIEGYDIGVGSIDHKYTVGKTAFEKAFDFFPVASVPRVIMQRDSDALGLKANDVVFRINRKEVLGEPDFFDYLYLGKVKKIDVLRAGKMMTVSPNKTFSHTVVDRVLPGSPAASVGIRPGDVFVSIEGTEVFTPEEVKLVTMTGASNKETLAYVFKRGGENIAINVTPDEDGLIGVALSPVRTTVGLDIQFYESFLTSSVLDVKTEKYGVLRAPFKAFEEIKNVSLITAKMMGEVFSGILRSGDVPDSVAGPIGIAQMTHISVQDGFMAVIRFAAILSLSLGVLNVLPFPALDGGRLVFVIFEMVVGHRISYKFEAMIHAMGFVILLMLIVLITWNDIARLF